MPDTPLFIGQLTRREFRERMAAGELRCAILPVAATEQHLEHLAMEHDWRSTLHVATRVAERLRPHVLIAPCTNVGISQHHMNHPGSLSASPGSFLAMLGDGLRSLHTAGFRNVLVLNGHGGNMAPVAGTWSQFLQTFECNLQFRSYWEFLPEEIAKSHLSTGRFPGHAQEFETAFALAAFPENVRHDAMQDQLDREPLAATAAAGTAMIDAIVDGVTAFVQRMIDGDEVAVIPPFMP
jgi:creatinine amidohydrolase